MERTSCTNPRECRGSIIPGVVSLPRNAVRTGREWVTAGLWPKDLVSGCSLCWHLLWPWISHISSSNPRVLICPMSWLDTEILAPPELQQAGASQICDDPWLEQVGLSTADSQAFLDGLEPILQSVVPTLAAALQDTIFRRRRGLPICISRKRMTNRQCLESLHPEVSD